MEETADNVKSRATKIDTSGRVLLPADLRSAYGFEVGDQIHWVAGEDGLRLKAYRDIVSDVQDYFCSLAPDSDVWSVDLISKRNKDAGNE